MRTQQTAAHWLANRTIAQLVREFREIEQHLGTEKAQEYIRAKGIKMLQEPAAAPFGIFDGKALRDAMAADGINLDVRK